MRLRGRAQAHLASRLYACLYNLSSHLSGGIIPSRSAVRPFDPRKFLFMARWSTGVAIAVCGLSVSLIAAGCGSGGGYGGGGTPPPAPTGLAATAGNAQIALSWTASSGATSYTVKRATTSGGPYTKIASPSVTNYTDTGLTNGATYYYVVSAVNSAGESANSAQASATPTAPGTPPTTPAGLQATAGNQQIALTWTASAGAATYNVLRGTTSGSEASVVSGLTSASYTDTGLTNGTTYYYEVSAANSSGTSANSTEVSAIPVGTVSFAVNVNVLADRHQISPFIYGGSFPECSQAIADSGLTIVRWGGNGSSEYNWQLGTTNADNDYYFEDFAWNSWSIGYPNPNCLGGPPATQESDSVKWIGDVQSAGGYPLMTMPMLNWVAQAPEASSNSGSPNYHWSFSVKKYGQQCHVDPYNTDAGDGIAAGSNCDSSPVYLGPADPNDAYFPLLDDPSEGCPSWATAGCTNAVYRSQWAAALTAAFNNATNCPAVPLFSPTPVGSCHFYDMDNEIDIWGGTHRDIHPNPSSYDELRDTYLAEAGNLKIRDPAAVRLGPVSCCWWFYWNSQTGAQDKADHAGIDFLPWWLNEIYWRDQIAGTRSLDMFDIHAYPDASTTGLTLAQKRALAVSIYRDYWDSTYQVQSALNSEFQYATSTEPKQYTPFRIPRMRALLNEIYPGTPLAFTEWSAEFAGAPDFSTAIGDADAYGIFGRDRLSLASRWTAPNSANPNYQALKLYTNYDGQHHGFAPISVLATSNGDPSLFSSYASISVDGKTLTLMVLDKDPANNDAVTFSLSGFSPSTFTSYTLSEASPTSIVAGPANQPWSPTITFAAYSVTLLVINGTGAVPAAEWDLNPDTVMLPASGTGTLKPILTSGSSSVTLGTATYDSGIVVSVTGKTITSTIPGSITVTAGATPGFYHFSIPATDGDGTATSQSGWIVVGNPAAALTKSGDSQAAPAGSTLTIGVTLNPGSSGGTNSGASILFTTSAGTIGGARRAIAVTNSSGVATITLTLPNTPGTFTVAAEGPYGLGHPVSTFTETAQ